MCTEQKYSDSSDDAQATVKRIIKRQKLPASRLCIPKPMSEQDLSNEKWLPVVGHETRFEVSNMGRIRSLYPSFGKGRPRKDADRLSTRILRDGYETLVTSYIDT